MSEPSRPQAVGPLAEEVVARPRPWAWLEAEACWRWSARVWGATAVDLLAPFAVRGSVESRRPGTCSLSVSKPERRGSSPAHPRSACPVLPPLVPTSPSPVRSRHLRCFAQEPAACPVHPRVLPRLGVRRGARERGRGGVRAGGRAESGEPFRLERDHRSPPLPDRGARSAGRPPRGASGRGSPRRVIGDSAFRARTSIFRERTHERIVERITREQEPPMSGAKISIRNHGPLRVEGEFTLVDQNGNSPLAPAAIP